MPDRPYLPLRNFWPSERDDFKQFIADNIDVISALIGMDLEFRTDDAARLKIGRAIVDLFARNMRNGANVVLELQIAPADDEHRRRLTKYHASHAATVLIWICESYSAEIIALVREHNRHPDAPFLIFAIVCRVPVVLPLAPYFEVVVRPEQDGNVGLPDVLPSVAELPPFAPLWATLLIMYPEERRRSHQWSRAIRFRKKPIGGWRVRWGAKSLAILTP